MLVGQVKKNTILYNIEICSCLNQVVSIFILLLEFHFLSSQFSLEVIHLSEKDTGNQEVKRTLAS